MLSFIAPERYRLSIKSRAIWGGRAPCHPGSEKLPSTRISYDMLAKASGVERDLCVNLSWRFSVKLFSFLGWALVISKNFALEFFPRVRFFLFETESSVVLLPGPVNEISQVGESTRDLLWRWNKPPVLLRNHQRASLVHVFGLLAQ